MQSRALALTLLVTIGAFAAGTLIAPSKKEVALMHLRDSDYEQALKLYGGLESKGDDSISVVVPLVNLYIHYGDTNKAISILENFTTKHKRSIDARKKLADLYKESQRLNDYCRELEAIQAMAPSVDGLRKLADTYDLLGLYPQEGHVLERLIDIKGYAPEEDDYVKLAVIDRVAGKPDDAIKAIKAGLDAKKYAVNMDTIHVAVQLLLEQHKGKDALAIANAYMQKSAKETDAITLSSLFQSYNKLDAAYEILTPYLSDIDKSVDLERQVVSVLLAQNRKNEVYELLNRQFTQNILPIPLTETLLDLAVNHKNFELIGNIVQKIDLEKIPQSSLLRYADFAFRTNLPDIARIMRERLSKDYLAQAPLLRAVLDVTADYSPKTMDAVLNLPESLMPLPEEKMVVSNIFIKYGYANRACALFEHIPINGIFEILDPSQVAILYLDANQVAAGEQKLHNADKDNPTVTGMVGKSLFFMAVGEGKTDEAQQWLKDHPANDPELILDAYYIASRYHRDGLALQFAQQIYKANPTPENQSQLTDALLANHRYADAVKILRKAADHGRPARQAYLDAVYGWVDYEGKTHSGKDLDLLSSTVSELSKLNLSVDEQRDLANLLEASGFHDLAEGYFVDVAANQPFDSPDVQNLLGFWNDHFSQPALDWITTRAKTAPPPEQLQWISYLDDANHPEVVVGLLRGDQHLSAPLMDVFLNALADMHNTDELHNVLKQAIDNEEDTDRLEHYADAAEEQNMQDLTAEAWQDVYDIDPNNIKAAKWLGLHAYDKRKYVDAERLLGQYLHEDNSDYRANFAYGDLLARQPAKKNNAAAFYKLALTEVSALDNPTPDILEDKARLLYLNHQPQQALDLLRKLLANDPENKSIRADLAETLIEMGQYKDASMLLPQ